MLPPERKTKKITRKGSTKWSTVNLHLGFTEARPSSAVTREELGPNSIVGVATITPDRLDEAFNGEARGVKKLAQVNSKLLGVTPGACACSQTRR